MQNTRKHARVLPPRPLNWVGTTRFGFRAVPVQLIASVGQNITNFPYFRQLKISTNQMKKNKILYYIIYCLI